MCPNSGLPCDMRAVIANARAALSAPPAQPQVSEPNWPSLYEKTGDIKDINTLLIPRSALAQPAAQQEVRYECIGYVSPFTNVIHDSPGGRREPVYVRAAITKTESGGKTNG